ncbi:MAG: DMT family transporter [Firmicutes bacterium]|nr:DMT family transporter [Bacillota bacterium]
MQLFIFALFTLLIGFVGALQNVFNNAMKSFIGLWETTFFVHLSGAVVALIAMLFFGQGTFWQLEKAPWFAWLGGVCGVIIISGIVLSIPRLGVVGTVGLFVFGQLLLSVLIDQFGLFGVRQLPLTFMKASGLVLMGLGLWFFFRG